MIVNKIILIILIFITNFCYSQCPENDIEISNSIQLSNFINNYSNCDSINVNVVIWDTDVDIDYLSNVKYFGGNLSIHDYDTSIEGLLNWT